VTLDPDEYVTISSDLSGGGTVRLDIPDTSQSDTAPTDPVAWWLKVFPTASETDPD
jgi:hypothetical protein